MLAPLTLFSIPARINSTSLVSNSRVPTRISFKSSKFHSAFNTPVGGVTGYPFQRVRDLVGHDIGKHHSNAFISREG